MLQMFVVDKLNVFARIQNTIEITLKVILRRENWENEMQNQI